MYWDDWDLSGVLWTRRRRVGLKRAGGDRDREGEMIDREGERESRRYSQKKKRETI